MSVYTFHCKIGNTVFTYFLLNIKPLNYHLLESESCPDGPIFAKIKLEKYILTHVHYIVLFSFPIMSIFLFSLSPFIHFIYNFLSSFDSITFSVHIRPVFVHFSISHFSFLSSSSAAVMTKWTPAEGSSSTLLHSIKKRKERRLFIWSCGPKLK